MEKQLQLALDQLEALARRLDEAGDSVKTVAFSTAQRIEEALARRVRRLEARGALLQAKAKAARAEAAAATNDFHRADELLADAADLFQTARETLGDDRVYELQLEAMKQDLRAATSAVRTRAQDTRSRIDRVLADTDRIVSALESDETRAAASPQA
jgi:surfactin synthase thioesterase subunit